MPQSARYGISPVHEFNHCPHAHFILSGIPESSILSFPKYISSLPSLSPKEFSMSVSLGRIWRLGHVCLQLP